MTKILSMIVIMLSSPAFADTHSAPTTVPSEPPAMEAKSDMPDVKGAIRVAKVMFIEPKDGATVSQKFKVKFGLEGMKVANAGKVVPGTGHHHLIIDGEPVAKGQVVPNDATHLHFGKGQTETTLELKPGKHSLTLQFADGTHVSYGDMMSQTIHITVK